LLRDLTICVSVPWLQICGPILDFLRITDNMMATWNWAEMAQLLGLSYFLIFYYLVSELFPKYPGWLD
jgi:hypothetical protein